MYISVPYAPDSALGLFYVLHLIFIITQGGAYTLAQWSCIREGFVHQAAFGSG